MHAGWAPAGPASGTAGSRPGNFLRDPVSLPLPQSITALISSRFPPSGAEDGCQALLQNALQINVPQSKRAGWGMGRGRKQGGEGGQGEVRVVLLASGTIREPMVYILGK